MASCGAGDVVCNSAMNVPTLTDPIRYHAFIVCCQQDLVFAKELLKYLENCNFKCLFAARDFLAGCHVTENIADAVMTSRRVVMLISEAFLRSSWCIFELTVTLEKMYENNTLVIIPLLMDIDGDRLPNLLKCVTYIDSREPDWLRKLTRDLAGPDISVESLLPAGNVAHGLAWSYFYGYLHLVLPAFKARVKRSKVWRENRDRMSTRLYILVPQSCRCSPSLTDADREIKYVGDLESISLNRGGVHQRVYRNTIYSVEDKQGEPYYFVGEYATIVQTMSEMESGGVAGLCAQQRSLQVNRFYRTLLSILTHAQAKDCHDNFRILTYEDNPKTGNRFSLSSFLLHEIQQEISSNIALEPQRIGLRDGLPRPP